jgi:hypothetical protein
MYQPKRFAISLSAISLYPSAISLSVDVRSRRRDRTAVPPARGAAVCRAGQSADHAADAMSDDASRGRCRTFDFETLVTH